jgi:hypothetical protein
MKTLIDYLLGTVFMVFVGVLLALVWILAKGF